jgi:hypothetical protein
LAGFRTKSSPSGSVTVFFYKITAATQENAQKKTAFKQSAPVYLCGFPNI